MGEFLGKKGIRRLSDLLEYYPRAYEDRRRARDIRSLSEGETVSLKAKIIKVGSQHIGKTRRVHDVLVSDESGQINCKYFRVPFKGYFEKLEIGKTVQVVGKVTKYRGRLEFHHPDLNDFQENLEGKDQLVPLYSETEGLSTRKVQKLVESAFEGLASSKLPSVDPLPEWIKKKYNLVSKIDAMKKIHHPPESAGVEFTNFTSPYHTRIKFEEFFWLELFLALNRTKIKKQNGIALIQKHDLTKRFREILPFKLTNDQEKSISEIFLDLSVPHPMHRLLQGDVGSGKTVVAFMAALLAIENGHQAALMVPTEILAKQHLSTAKKILEPLGIKVGLLVSDLSGKERAATLAQLKDGVISFCVGTQAIIQEGVEFKNLSLVIVDEQHRFGVKQREQLKHKGVSPHLLLMTATPIPRSLALTVYGDLDLSIIREKPPGRTQIVTRVTFQNKRPQILAFLATQVGYGRQAYYIFPLVEESEKVDLKNAVDEYEKLKTEMPEINFGLLHGRMSSQEKEDVMSSFRKGNIQVLVSTTVIEVGVDVPNATLIIIEHAERFGLSQLHQLRGRVGRGALKSYCVLVLGYAVGPESKERVQWMERTNDGFELSEADLKIRGPGEFLGTRQSGMAGFKMANLINDIEILKSARVAAQELVVMDPELKMPVHAAINEEIIGIKGRYHFLSIG